MSELIYKTYDLDSLNAQYDNRAKVSGVDDIIQTWRDWSENVRTDVNHRLNMCYGSTRAETLDVFIPDDPHNAPVQVFFHGGYWKALHKDDFSYVANGFLPKGVITVVVNYALIPTINMTELIRQCRASLIWIWNNANEFSGDRNRIYISGHSAGGHIAAMMMATDWPKLESDLPQDLVKGACGISGLYDLEPIRLCFLNDDLRLSKNEVEQFSPLKLEREGKGEMLLPVGKLEGPEYLYQSESLRLAWESQGTPPEVKVLAGQDHFSIADQLNDPDSEICRLIHNQMF